MTFSAAVLTTVMMLHPPTEYAPYEQAYHCDNGESGDETDGGPQYYVTLATNSDRHAMVNFNGDEEMASTGQTERTEMIRVISGSGVRYVGEQFEFHMRGGEGMLSFGGVTQRCVQAAAREQSEFISIYNPVADAGASPLDPIEVPGRSWGGRLRAGPSMQYDAIGSLAEGARVTLLQNSGYDMNGHAWFRIRTESGQEAYQWGGLLCSDALHIIGIAGDC